MAAASSAGGAADGDVSIFVTKISTTKLRNVEMMYGDKNDVYCLLKFGDKWNVQTTTMWEGGSDVSWTYSEATDANMKWKTTMSDLASGVLSVTAMDANKMTAAKLIGLGDSKVVVPASFNKMGSGSSTELTVDVPLYEKAGGKTAGSVSVLLQIVMTPQAQAQAQAQAQPPVVQKASEPVSVSTPVPVAVPVAAQIVPSSSSSSSAPATAASLVQTGVTVEKPTPISFSNGTLHIKRIKCSDLKSVEMMGKNDPYVTLDFGTESFRTEAIEDAGSEALFDFLDIRFQVQEDLIKFENITIKVFDRNSLRSDVLIGSSALSIKNTMKRLGEDTDLSFDIHDEKGKKSGKITAK